MLAARGGRDDTGIMSRLLAAARRYPLVAATILLGLIGIGLALAGLADSLPWLFGGLMLVGLHLYGLSVLFRIMRRRARRAAELEETIET